MRLFYGTRGMPQESINAVSRTASDAREQVGSLEQRVERLSLVCEALWALVKEKTGCSDDDLVSMMAQVDLQDGSADGKVRRDAKQCPACHRNNATRHTRCLYCGQPLPAGSPFP